LTRLQGISTYLDKHHHDKYLIINLSERAYNYEVFHNNVIEFRFPGYPSPPLDRLLSINQSIHSWIQADHENVVVLHCQAGKGRTVSSVAAYLAWARVNIPDNKNSDNADTVSTLTVDRAVDLIAQRLNTKRSELVIPTQQRYIRYIEDIYNEPHRYPSSKPIVIEGILMNTIPAFEQTTITPNTATSSPNNASSRASAGQ
jgi:protein tyrosine phosphatase